MEHEGDHDANCNWCSLNDPQRLGKGSGGVGNRKKDEDHADNSIVKIYQNTRKSPEEI